MPKLYTSNAPLASGGAAQMPTNTGKGQGLGVLGQAVQGIGDTLTSVQLAFDHDMKTAQRVTDVSGEYNKTVTDFYSALETIKKDNAENPALYREKATQALQDRIKQGRDNLGSKDAQTLNAYEAQANGYMAQLTPHLFTDAAAMIDARGKVTRQEGATQWIKDHLTEENKDTLTTRWESFKQQHYLPAINAKLLSPSQAKLELTAISQQFLTERAYLKMQSDPKAALAELNQDLFAGPSYEPAKEGEQTQEKPYVDSIGRAFMPSEALKVFNAMASQKEQGHDLALKHGKEYWTTEANARFIAHIGGKYSLTDHMKALAEFKDQPEVHEHLLNRMIAYDSAVLANNKAHTELEEKARTEAATNRHKAISVMLANGIPVMSNPENRKVFEEYQQLTMKSDEHNTLLKAVTKQFDYGPGNEAIKDAMKLSLMVDPNVYSVPDIITEPRLNNLERQEVLQTKQTWEAHVKANGDNWMSTNAKYLEGKIPGKLGQDNMGLGGAEANRRVAAAQIQFRYEMKRQFDANKGYVSPAQELAIYENSVKSNRITSSPYYIPPSLIEQYPMDRAGLNKFIDQNKDTLGVTDPAKFLEITQGYLYEIQKKANQAVDLDEEEADKRRKAVSNAVKQ